MSLFMLKSLAVEKNWLLNLSNQSEMDCS